MTAWRRRSALVFVVVAALLVGLRGRADEGFWLFNAPPKAAIAQALTMMQVKFKGIDVLADGELRQGIKEFSSWPTIPQLYVKGEFVGGCDIVREMFESGELKKLFDQKGVDYAS